MIDGALVLAWIAFVVWMANRPSSRQPIERADRLGRQR